MAQEDLDRNSPPWRVVPEIAGGGRWVDLGSHMLDFLDFALGPIAEVHGFASNQAAKYEAEDIVTSTFRFASGVHGTGAWCFSAFNDYDETEIVGDEGKVSFSIFGADPIKLTTREGTIEFSFENPPHIAQPLIQSVVNDLNGVGTCPSTGETAARTSWVMDQMLDVAVL